MSDLTEAIIGLGAVFILSAFGGFFTMETLGVETVLGWPRNVNFLLAVAFYVMAFLVTIGGCDE